MNSIGDNNFKIVFDAKSQNESLARVVIAAFLTGIDPTLDELNDIKTAVSEAVTNSIIHGYEEKYGSIEMCGNLIVKKYDNDNKVNYIIRITVRDEGVGIENVERAREPLFTTKADQERSGMGFMFMEMFMDKVEVESEPDKGTVVIMEKKIKRVKKQR